MKYEVVQLPEKMFAGVTSRTNNQDPQMPMIIGGLWKKLFEQGIYQTIPNKANAKSAGTYSDFSSDVTGEYTAGAMCEVSSFDGLPEDIERITVPAGKYAKFIVVGNIPVQTAVQKFWEEVWQTELPMNYIFDFEEYQDQDMENAVIHIYISIN